MSRFSPRFSPFSKPLGAPVPQPVAEVLGRTDAFAALRAGVEQTAALQRDLSELLPDYLASSVEPGFVRDGALTLFTAHSALAARLRHLEPRLVADLQQRGWSIRTVTVKIRPRSAAEPPAPKMARMTPRGAEALQALSDTLPASPLKTALARMAARHRKAGPTDEKK